MFKVKQFGFHEAMELAFKGISVSSRNWGFIDRMTGNGQTTMVEVDNIWLEENKRIGKLLFGDVVPVLPYFTRMTEHGIEYHKPTFTDVNSHWMKANDYLHLNKIKHLPNDELELEFIICDDITSLRHNLPLWMLYNSDVVGFGYTPYVISTFSHMVVLLDALVKSVNLYANFRDRDTLLTKAVIPHDSKGYVVDPSDWDIYETFDTKTLFILDMDSLNRVTLLNGENAYDYFVAQIKSFVEANPQHSWIGLSLQEQISFSREHDDLLTLDDKEVM